jgi:hypothetical protein
MAYWIFVEFGMEFMPLSAVPNSYILFYFPAISNTNLMVNQSHEVGG